MKLMIASDIHGSAYYCKILLGFFEKLKADRLLLLGDILYHGARNDLSQEYDTKKVTKMLNEYKDSIFAVRGNCDSAVDEMVLEFPLLADYALLFVNNRLIYATHGHLHGIDNPPLLKKGDALLTGHTHIPSWEEFGDDNLYINPGSVSIPKNNSDHSFITLDGNELSYYSIDKEKIYHSLKI